MPTLNHIAQDPRIPQFQILVTNMWSIFIILKVQLDLLEPPT